MFIDLTRTVISFARAKRPAFDSAENLENFRVWVEQNVTPLELCVQFAEAAAYAEERDDEDLLDRLDILAGGMLDYGNA